MYTNTAYLGKKDEDIIDQSKSLIVTAAGYYKVCVSPMIHTERPEGRKDYQLYYVAAGKVHLYLHGTEERIIEKGNMILFYPGEPQKYFLYLEDKPETYWCHFTGKDVEKILLHYEMPREQSVFYVGTSPDYQWVFRQMIQELQLQRTNFEDMLSLNLQHILLIINRFIHEKVDFRRTMFDEVEKAKHYFNEHYREPIVVEEYAKKYGMTANWFSQNFRRITKVTPMQYIISLRINHSVDLIDPIGQIAAAVGYENTMYFSRLFKKHTGMTPTEYKKRDKTKEKENKKQS